MSPECDGHPEPDELERYSLGDSIKDECARVEEHLLVCAACRRRVQDHDEYVSAMRSAAAEWREQHPPTRPMRRYTPMVPVALISVVVAAALWLEWFAFRRIPPAFPVVLSATRGTRAQAPARRQLDLKPDLAGLAVFPHYDLKVAERAGGPVARAQAGPAATRIPGLPPGAYFVRIYSPAGEMLREYPLLVTD